MDKTASIMETLRTIIIEIIHKNDFALAPTSTFKSIGANHLDKMQILMQIERTYNIQLDDARLKSVNNFGQLVQYIEELLAGGQSVLYLT